MEDYPKIYQIPIGAKVTINECPSIPQSVGKEAAICGWVDPQKFGSPLMLMLDETIYLPIPGAPIAVAFQGPVYCRPDEVAVVGNVPDVFNKAFKEKSEGDIT